MVRGSDALRDLRQVRSAAPLLARSSSVAPANSLAKLINMGRAARRLAALGASKWRACHRPDRHPRPVKGLESNVRRLPVGVFLLERGWGTARLATW